MDRSPIVAMLESRGAGSIDHPGGTLLEHLQRVAYLLEAWGAANDLVVAGLAHAAYGTDGFDVTLLDLEERPVLAGVVGADAEAIVYRYAACDRAFTLGQIGRREPVMLRDRFAGVTVELDARAVNELAELSLANELDLARHNEAFRRANGDALGALFSSWAPVVSDTAYATYLDVFGSRGA